MWLLIHDSRDLIQHLDNWILLATNQVSFESRISASVLFILDLINRMYYDSTFTKDRWKTVCSLRIFWMFWVRMKIIFTVLQEQIGSSALAFVSYFFGKIPKFVFECLKGSLVWQSPPVLGGVVRSVCCSTKSIVSHTMYVKQAVFVVPVT